MNFKNHIFFVFLFFGIGGTSAAQEYGDPERYLIDSLDLSQLIERDVDLIETQLDIFHLTDSDSVKVKCLETIIDDLSNEIWIKYNKYAYEFLLAKTKEKGISKGEKYFFTSQMAGTINNMGFAVNAEGNAFMAVDYYMHSNKIFENLGDSAGMALTYVNAATAYNNAGEIVLSNEMDLKGIEIGRLIGDMKILSVGYKNIGMKQFNAEKYDEALENTFASLKYAKLLPEDPVAEAVSLMGLGQIYSTIRKDSLANKYYTDALRIKKKFATEASYIGSLEIYGEHLQKQLFRLDRSDPKFKEYKDSTLSVLNEVLEGALRLNQVNTLIRTYNELSKFYLFFKQPKRAVYYSDLGFELANQTSNLSKKQKAAYVRYLVHKESGNYKLALEMLEFYNKASDKLNYDKAEEVASRNKFKLEYTVKAAQDSIQFAIANEINQREIKHQNEQIEADTRQKWILYSGIGLIAIFSFFLFKKFRQTQSQNKLIQHQKEQIVEAHTEMRSSIEYAKRLQTAILPSINTVKNRFAESFILFKPKDIVSGDFYWFENAHGFDYIAAADCTGHGVPGAMVSVVCSNALHQALHEFQLMNPSEILNKTRELVIDTFAKSGDNVKDGMDISLCRINQASSQIEYCGANNPLWILRKGSQEIEEVKADKQPVGLYSGMKDFTSHQVEVHSGDQIYLFTDGYADQFGGEKGKKMKYKPFKKLLVQLSYLPTEDQKNQLDQKFEEWRGDHEQIDDVCVVGIRL